MVCGILLANALAPQLCREGRAVRRLSGAVTEFVNTATHDCAAQK
jgi:hypothetical protein